MTPRIFWDSRFADAAPAASTTAAGYAAANLADMRPYTWWKPTALPATVTVDCASAKAADFLAVYGHDLYTQGATITVRGSTDNFSTSDVELGSKTPTDNLPFVVTFNSASYRYWRIRITGTTMPSLAIAMIGAALDMVAYLPFGFDPTGRQAKGQANRSEGGQPLGKSVMFEEWKETLNFRSVTPAWLRATFTPAWQAHLRGKPFLFGWELTGYPAELYLVLAGDTFKAPQTSPNLCDLSFDVAGVL